MDDFGKYLKKLRGKDSIRETAKKVGISHTYLSTLEKGYDPRTNKERKPSIDILRKLSKFYDVNYLEMLTRAGYIDENTTQDDLLYYMHVWGDVDEKEYKLISQFNEVRRDAPDEIDVGMIIDYILVGTPVKMRSRILEKNESILIAQVLSLLIDAFDAKEESLDKKITDQLFMNISKVLSESEKRKEGD